MKYLDINKILSYNKLFSFIVGERGNGKTYGALNHCVKRFINHGEEFIYLRRYKTELKPVATLFAPLIANNPDYDIKYKNKVFYFKDKPMCYTQALTQVIIQASAAFPKVSWIIFDEFMMRPGVYHYLRNEVDDYFLHFLLTVSRYRDVRCIFVANAYSNVNPYFDYFDIDLSKSNVWTNDDIVAYRTNEVEFKQEILQTRMGKFIANTNYGDFAIDNEFKLDSYDFISKRTSNARYKYDLILDSLKVGVWYDNDTGNFFLSYDCSKNGPHSMCYSLSHENLVDAKIYVKNVRGIFQLEYLGKMYRYGKLYYEDLKIKNVYSKVISKW